MSYLHWAAIGLALMAYGAFCVFIGCCLRPDDRSGIGGLAAGFAAMCGFGAVVFWWI